LGGKSKIERIILSMRNRSYLIPEMTESEYARYADDPFWHIRQDYFNEIMEGLKDDMPLLEEVE
jgi:hypothetical protein